MTWTAILRKQEPTNTLRLYSCFQGNYSQVTFSPCIINIHKLKETLLGGGLLCLLIAECPHLHLKSPNSEDAKFRPHQVYSRFSAFLSLTLQNLPCRCTPTSYRPAPARPGFLTHIQGTRLLSRPGSCPRAFSHFHHLDVWFARTPPGHNASCRFTNGGPLTP